MASRNVFFFFELLFWPIVGVLSIGLMTRFLHLTPEQASFVLIGTIALSVVNVCQLEVAYAVLLDVWSKSLKHQFLAPIGIRHLTLGSWIVGMVRSWRCSCCWPRSAGGRSTSGCSSPAGSRSRRFSWAAFS